VEYLAFGLLGLGAIFIMIGIASSLNGKSEKLNKTLPGTGLPSISSEKQTDRTKEIEINEHKLTHDTPNQSITSKLPIIPNSGSINDQTKKIQLKKTEADRFENDFIKNIELKDSKDYALFFVEDAILYVDKSKHNVYENDKFNYRLLNTGNIHRIGQGKLSFDGFNLFYEDKNVREVYKLIDIVRLNFYSNCFTITKKQTGITSIFFIDSTERIKFALKNHKMVNAPQ